jgi:hypothetical protein
MPLRSYKATFLPSLCAHIFLFKCWAVVAIYVAGVTLHLLPSGCHCLFGEHAGNAVCLPAFALF